MYEVTYYPGPLANVLKTCLHVLIIVNYQSFRLLTFGHLEVLFLLTCSGTGFMVQFSTEPLALFLFWHPKMTF